MVRNFGQFSKYVNEGLTRRCAVVGVDSLDLVVASPDDLATTVHAHRGLLATKLDNDAALIVTQGDIVGATDAGNCPHTLEAIVEGVLEAVCVCVPYPDGS